MVPINRIFPSFLALLGPLRTTAAQRRALLRLIATASEERLPLAPLLEAWAEEERGTQPARLNRVAKALREGVSLPAALERVPGVLSDEENLLVRFSSESGTLASSLRRRLDAPVETTAFETGNYRRVKNYLLMFLVIGLPLCFLASSMARPVYAHFDLPAPYTLQVSESILHFILNLSVVGGPFLLLALAVSGIAAWPGRYFRRRVVPRVLPAIRSGRVAAVLDRLAESATSGRPLTGALATLARYHYDPALRHKLLHVRNELELGADLWPTMSTAGLLTRPETAALTASDGAGAQGWALSALAEVRHRRVTRRLNLLSAVLVPLVVFVFGVFVLIQTVGMFSTLTQLIERLA